MFIPSVVYSILEGSFQRIKTVLSHLKLLVTTRKQHSHHTNYDPQMPNVLPCRDFNNDGDLSVAELTTLYDAGKGMHAILLKTDISGEQKIDDVLSYCGIILSQVSAVFERQGL